MLRNRRSWRMCCRDNKKHRNHFGCKKWSSRLYKYSHLGRFGNGPSTVGKRWKMINKSLNSRQDKKFQSIPDNWR